jgi:hypothetical protein
MKIFLLFTIAALLFFGLRSVHSAAEQNKTEINNSPVKNCNKKPVTKPKTDPYIFPLTPFNI